MLKAFQELKGSLNQEFGTDVQFVFVKGEGVKQNIRKNFEFLPHCEPIKGGILEALIKRTQNLLQDKYELVWQYENEDCTDVYCAVYAREHNKHEVLDNVKHWLMNKEIN